MLGTSEDFNSAASTQSTQSTRSAPFAQSADSGYTLLEVLIATMIVSTAMAGLMSVFLVASRQSTSSVNKSSAAFYQKRIFDELKQYLVEAPWTHHGHAANCASNPTCDDCCFGEIHHTCTCNPACTDINGRHYMLQDTNGTTAGGTVHQAIRPDGTKMLPDGDDLVVKFAATASYTVTDNADGTKSIQASVTYTEDAP